MVASRAARRSAPSRGDAEHIDDHRKNRAPRHSQSSGISKCKTKSKGKPAPNSKLLEKFKSKVVAPPAQHTAPTIPFETDDRILLFGEGDLSFARALVRELGCERVTATVFEKEAELREKYPQVGENIDMIQGLEEGEGRGVKGRVVYGVDATKIGPVWREFKGKCDRIVFNFPHVGGKSTDVNRQVRYNQELLVAFFKNALPALAPSTSAITPSASSRASGEGKTSSIIVTLFEGEPYTLWNIRDLARHAGLQVDRSFKFQAAAYPGYKHARTLGVVKAKNGVEGGGWKGEERSARSYVFVRKGEGSTATHVAKKKVESSDDDDDEVKDDIEVEDDWTSGGIDESVIHPSRRANVPGS